MKHAQFDYVNQFHCLAGDCPDTCCKDWQIILDEDAIARYASLPGELGEQVRAAMLTENGETRFRERGGNCVLLRDDGLCPLQAAYGAEMLCRTCFTHPRFTEEYGQTAELTLSASCPEAARLLLEHDAPLTLTVRYYLNDVLIDNFVPMQRLLAGAHALTLFYPFASVEANSVKRLSVRLVCAGGTVQIEKYGIKATVTGQGMTGELPWDGVIELEELLTPVAITPPQIMFGTLAEEPPTLAAEEEEP